MCVIDDVIANLRTTVNNVLAMSIRTVLRSYNLKHLQRESLNKHANIFQIKAL